MFKKKKQKVTGHPTRKKKALIIDPGKCAALLIKQAVNMTPAPAVTESSHLEPYVFLPRCLWAKTFTTSLKSTARTRCDSIPIHGKKQNDVGALGSYCALVHFFLLLDVAKSNWLILIPCFRLSTYVIVLREYNTVCMMKSV